MLLFQTVIEFVPSKTLGGSLFALLAANIEGQDARGEPIFSPTF
jgi:hypothetical protein